MGTAVSTIRAETFGHGENSFSVEFVTVSNPGNADDSAAGGGAYFSPYGRVPYTFRIGVTEVPREWVTKAANLGLLGVTSGPWIGNQPACNLTWFEAAAFVNWLNTSTGYQAAYNLTFTGTFWTMAPWSSAEASDTEPGPAVSLNVYRHKNARYFLPSEHEWYKAAYHKNDGVTGNYWDYATGSDNPPIAVTGGTANGTAVFAGMTGIPADVEQAGGLSAYGTKGQTGNVYEWTETDFDGVNDEPLQDRTLRGGNVQDAIEILRSSYRNRSVPPVSDPFIGFRVATLADSDGDGTPDQFETNTGIYVSKIDTGSNPANPDSDGDGLTDGQEVDGYRSDPNVRDTDGDGFEDGFEVDAKFDPTSAASTPEILASMVPATVSTARFRFNAANGINYRIEASYDLATWGTIEPNIPGVGGAITRFYSTAGIPKRFFRPRRN